VQPGDVDGGWAAFGIEGRTMMKNALKYFGWLVLLAWHTSLWAVQVVDDRQVTISFVQSPQRIVSLLPSLTESVCALGQCQRLVGVDRYSNYPTSVKQLAQLGGGMDPNIEAIVALRPDVVLMAVSSRTHERLTALGIKVVTLEPETHADVKRVLQTLGQLLDIPPEQGALRVWRLIDAGVAAAAQSVPAQAQNTKVYFEVDSAPYAAGQASFIGETLIRLGGKNIVPLALGSFPKLNPEFVVRANPDLIMVGDGNQSGMAERPGWAGIRAIREQRVCVFKPEESDVLVRPGPRMAEAARIMARCLVDKGPLHQPVKNSVAKTVPAGAATQAAKPSQSKN
jgi:iron complex transport system substrate-binding protein